jgi:hypothetical protein
MLKRIRKERENRKKLGNVYVSCSTRDVTSHNTSSIAWRVQVLMIWQMKTWDGQSNAAR